MKIQCACGSLIHDGTDGLSNKAHIVPDQRWDTLFDEIDDLIEKRCATAAQREAACMKVRSLLSAAARLAWQCRSCGRLYVDDADRALQCYAPAEAGTSRDLFRALKPPT
jgi:hypothetical protein